MEGQRNFQKHLEYDVAPYASTVESIKDDPVKAKDVIKVGNKEGEDMNYDVAFRGLENGKIRERQLKE